MFANYETVAQRAIRAEQRGQYDIAAILWNHASKLAIPKHNLYCKRREEFCKRYIHEVISDNSHKRYLNTSNIPIKSSYSR